MSQTPGTDPQSEDPKQQFHELVVHDVIRETADASSFVFDIPEPLAPLFEYTPGQFLTFLIPWQDFEIRRCYSLSSAPGWDERPKVTVKRVAQGRMSNWMNDNLKAGDRIQVLPPAGHFVLHDVERPLFLFGAGSGITPVISLLKQALRNTTRKIKMVYANRDAASVIFRAEIDEIAAAHADRFELIHHLDAERGFIDGASIKAHAEGWLGADFYICGPTPFMDTIEETLDTDTLDWGHLTVERFVSAHDPDRSVEIDAAPTQQSTPSRVVINLDGQRHEVDYREGETLLEAGIRAGVDVPSSCRDGYCACCMARLKRGEVYMPVHEALSKKELAAGWILACQARPTTPECEIDYDE